MAAPIAGIIVFRFLCSSSVQIPTTKRILASLRWPLCRCDYHASSFLYKMKSGARLEKMLSKKKKKFYYDPMNTAQLGKLAVGASGGKAKTRSEDSIRLRTYNKILQENISEMLSTNLISEELEQLQLTVLGVRVTGDMSACRVYWMSTGTVEEDDRIEKILNQHKGPLRHALISHRVLGKIPPIFFLKDKASASISEIDRLLAVADFGPDEEDAIIINDQEVDKSQSDGRLEFMQKTDKPEALRGDTGGLAQPSLFGIDHAAVNQMIHANKNLDYTAPASGLDDRNLDRQFQQFRAFLKKKKSSKAERKQSAFYKGELEADGSTQSKEVIIEDIADEEESTGNVDKYYDDEDYENVEESVIQEQDDDFTLTDKPTRDK